MTKVLDRDFIGRLRGWMRDYIIGFYGNDAYKNDQIRLKQVHTGFVCLEMNELTYEMHMSLADRCIAEATALLHDIGRFEQMRRFGTYNDSRTINHSCLGRQLIEQKGLLSDIEPETAEYVLTAVEFHGVRDIPEGLSERQLFFLKLIRDADKQDIFRVSIAQYHAYLANPDLYRDNVGFSLENTYRLEIVDALLKGGLIGYGLARTYNDFKLLQLGWIYDINFEPTLRKIRAREYLDFIFSVLPDDERIRTVKKHIMDYADRKQQELAGQIRN